MIRHGTLLDIAAPAAEPGSIQLIGQDLRAALDRLARFADKGKAPVKETCRYLWMYAADRRFVGVATDLAATGQVDLPVTVGADLPHVGIDVADYSKSLATRLGRAKSLVTLAVADGELTFTIEGDAVAAIPARGATTIDRAVLHEVHTKLAGARAAVTDSQLPHGYTTFKADLQARFTGERARCWYLPGGRAYVEVDHTFRGYIHAATPPPGARRPLPAGQVLPAIPTERTAA